MGSLWVMMGKVFVSFISPSTQPMAKDILLDHSASVTVLYITYTWNHRVYICLFVTGLFHLL